jgi:hypothetical protein
MKLHIIVTAFRRPLELVRLCYDFLLQSNPEWQMRIIHDGIPPEGLADAVASLKDRRIEFDYTKVINGFWGHVNRRMMLFDTTGDKHDYVLITNDDNQYVRIFWEEFCANGGPDVGFMYCDMLHNYWWPANDRCDKHLWDNQGRRVRNVGAYNLMRTAVALGRIDMGCFVVRLDIAQVVGFNHIVNEADGLYAEECAEECRRQGLRIVKIEKPLFIHN